MKCRHVVSLIIITSTFIEFTFGFNLGETRVFHYEARITTGNKLTEVNEKQGSKEIGYRISADVLFSTLWENSEKNERLLKIEMRNLKYEFDKDKSPILQGKQYLPLYVHKKYTEFEAVYLPENMEPVVKNIYKGLASILHYRKGTGSVTETDVIGKCQTTYKVDNSKLMKLKEHCHPNQSNSLRSAFVNFTSFTIYDLDNENNVKEINAYDEVSIASNLWKQGTASIHSRTHLKITDEIQAAAVFSQENIEDVVKIIEKEHNEKISRDAIVGEKNVVLPSKSLNKDMESTVKSYKKYLETENLATISSASLFLRLLKYFRNCPSEDLKKLLENKKLHSVLPQILDLVAFGGNPTSIAATFQVLQNTIKQTDLIERFLLGLSLKPNPTTALVEVVLNFLQNSKLDDKVRASTLSAVGAFIKNFNNNTIDDEVVKNAVQSLTKGLEDCKSDDCKLMYLKGLRNAGAPSTKSLLMTTAEKSGRTTLEALKAIKNIGFKGQEQQCASFCNRILRNPKQDNSAKAMAFEILLDCYSSNTNLVGDLLLSVISSEKKSEYSVSVISKLRKSMAENEQLRSQIFHLLSTKDLQTYFSIFQEGSSFSFAKPLILTNDVNSTYGIDMEMLPGGLLKRSSFDINIKGREKNLHLISVGMFAEGLGSFVGESSDDESPKAGIELSILEISLRPYIFFESTSELMGHAWSGTASEPTPVLQGNILLTDHSENIILQNGLIASLQLQGVLSADLSGAVQISLWNKNSNSQVQNGAAFLMMGAVTVNGFNNAIEDKINYRGETSLDFLTYFDFSDDPFKMCLQMMITEFNFLIDKNKYSSLDSGKFWTKRSKKRKILVPAKSYALHRKNAEVCSQVLEE